MRIASVLTLGVLLCCGCGPRVFDEREVSLEIGDIQPIVFGPFNKEQTVTITVSSPGAPISVYVYEREQREFVDYAISYGKEPENTLAGAPSTEDVTLTALIPADKEAEVRLQPTGQKPATVKLKISG